jgi:type III restriction enzyme
LGVETIDRLIINSPYEEPKQHWSYDRATRLFTLNEGRRPAGYLVASESSQGFDDPGEFRQIALVNQIRPRVKRWRDAGYPGATGISKRLLDYWNDPDEREHQFFFCQLEAVETLIWLTEAPEAEKVGIKIACDTGPFQRLCSKMATGSGKTVVMAMLIAWQVLNKITYPTDPRFSKYIFVVAPGLTIKSRLQVLVPSNRNNYYDEFGVVPVGFLDKLRQGRILVQNWHVLNWETAEQLAKKKSVDKRGVKSHNAYVNGVLGELAKANNIVVINDEAHHAWRTSEGTKLGESKQDIEEATIWIGGLDRIHTARGILACYDFTATPFVPSGRVSSEEALFSWIISDFGLNDAIESGLVKTPRIVVRDDGKLDKAYKSRFYHLFNDPDVKDNLTRPAKDYEPLPDLVVNGYYLLGVDWLETATLWKERRFSTPPVMISVANRTETAARIKYAFDHKKIKIDELCDSERILHIDSKVLAEAESQTEELGSNESRNSGELGTKKRSKKEEAEFLRQQVDTVGQVGKPGESIQNVISVQMLSEGWDAKTVTHIMGLRAFRSQLLCEQVIGRGLRRTSYEINAQTGLFDAEYVNIFGVPFTFLPHEKPPGVVNPPLPKTRIEAVSEKRQYEVVWPNIVRIDNTFRPVLSLDMERVKPLTLNAYDIAELVEIAPLIDGQPDVTKTSQIALEDLGRRYRTQRIIFEVAAGIFDQIKPLWKGNVETLLPQLIQLVERFVSAGKIEMRPRSYQEDSLKHRILFTLSMEKVVQHILEEIRLGNTESLVPVFDTNKPIRSTEDMRPWYTAKACEYTQKSHINFCVFDSRWEETVAFKLDHNPFVEAWAKNDHLGFDILYIYRGIVRKYWPDFIVRLTTGKMLIVEVKGEEIQQDTIKWGFLSEWVTAVNDYGSFGEWAWEVCKEPREIDDIIKNAI